MEKQCVDCKEHKALDQFAKSWGSIKMSNSCRDCLQKKRQEDPKKLRLYNQPAQRKKWADRTARRLRINRGDY